MTAPNEFEALLSEYGRRRDPRVGDRVSGTVVSIGAEHVFVDVGAKAEGVLDIDQVTDAEGRVAVAVGDPIEATVARRDDRTGQLMLRVRLTGGRQSYEDIEQAYADGLPVEGLVTGTNKGGVEVRIGAARAFCPISQLDLGFVEHAEDYVGQRLAFLIAKYEGGARPNIVLSRRALLEQEQRAQAEKTLETLEVGSVVSGTVTSVRDYGAFVDIGGIEGMVHVSELGFGHVAHPSEVLSVGQRVEVAVLRIEETGDPKRPRKIALSVRALARDPWEDVDRRFAAGTRVRGKVVRIQPFGAFVELAPGLLGLVHVSELGAGRRVNHPREVVAVGDEVEATVLSVDRDRRRIALSMAAARDEDAARDERDAAADYRPPSGGLGTLGDLLKKSLGDRRD